MAYVITQSCCSDASCVRVCPVGCIHPAPGEPDFGTTEAILRGEPDRSQVFGAGNGREETGGAPAYHHNACFVGHLRTLRSRPRRVEAKRGTGLPTRD